MSSRLQILEPELLDNKIRHYQLKIKDDLNDLSKAFELIKQVSESFNDLEEFGIKVFNKKKSLINPKEC